MTVISFLMLIWGFNSSYLGEFEEKASNPSDTNNRSHDLIYENPAVLLDTNIFPIPKHLDLDTLYIKYLDSIKKPVKRQAQ